MSCFDLLNTLRLCWYAA